MTLKNKLFRISYGRDYSPGDNMQVSLFEMAHYLWKRGGIPMVRGFFWQYRFRSAGRQLLIGKNVDLLFGKHISLGTRVYIGIYVYLNGLSQEGFQIGNNVRIREHTWIQATSTLENPGKGLT